MGMGDGDRQRVGGIMARWSGLGQQHAEHHADLRLVAMAGADDGLLDKIRCVFGDQHPGLGGHHEGDAAGLAELQGGGGVLVDEGGLNRRLVRPVCVDHLHHRVMERHQPHGERGRLVGLGRAAGDVDETVALDLDHPPAGAAEPGIDAKDANRSAHDLRDSPAGRARLVSRAASPVLRRALNTVEP